MSQGLPLLVEDVCDDFDLSAIDHVIERNFSRKSAHSGCSDIDVADGFAMYMATQLLNPKIPQESSSRMIIVDFTMTTEGLENYILYQALSKSKPVSLVNL